jgi:hypothetical protein
MKPYDHTHGYQTILGSTQVTGLTLANFEGAAACGGAPDGPVHALSNHLNAPNASHPVFLKQVGVQTVPLLQAENQTLHVPSSVAEPPASAAASGFA